MFHVNDGLECYWSLFFDLKHIMITLRHTFHTGISISTLSQVCPERENLKDLCRSPSSLIVLLLQQKDQYAPYSSKKQYADEV